MFDIIRKFITRVADAVFFDNTLNQTLSNANPGTATITSEGLLGSTSGDGRQVYFVLQPVADSRVYLTMGVNSFTQSVSGWFLLHLYTVDADSTLSSQPAVFFTTTTAGTAGVDYATFDLRGYALTAGQIYVMLVTPTSGKCDFSHFNGWLQYRQGCCGNTAPIVFPRRFYVDLSSLTNALCHWDDCNPFSSWDVCR